METLGQLQRHHPSSPANSLSKWWPQIRRRRQTQSRNTQAQDHALIGKVCWLIYLLLDSCQAQPTTNPFFIWRQSWVFSHSWIFDLFQLLLNYHTTNTAALPIFSLESFTKIYSKDQMKKKKSIQTIDHYVLIVLLICPNVTTTLLEHDLQDVRG